MRLICRAPDATDTGFTLIELLIVVAIIAILAAIAVPNFLEAQTRAKVSRTKADIKSLVTACEIYKLDTNRYLEGLLSTDVNEKYIAGNAEPNKLNITKLTSPIAYLSSLPANPPFGEYMGYSPYGPEKGYRYYGGDYWLATRDGNIPSIFPTSYKSVSYLWFVIGPSKKYSVRHTTVPPRFIPYEPTNGTVSIGEITYAAGTTAGWHSFQ